LNVRWSIRWRLTLLNTLTLAVLLIGFAALIYGLLARELIESVDGRLVECQRQFERDGRVANDPSRLKYLIEEFWEHEQIAGAVYSADGRLLMRTDALANDAVPGPQSTAPDARQFHSTTLPIVGRQRVMALPLPHADDGRTVILTTSLADADHTLGGLRAVLVTAVPIMLAVSAMAAYLLAGRALAPVKTLARETRTITANSLDRRLPVFNAHDELGQLTVTVNSMVDRLQRSFDEMRRFTADASHELRTPLTVIRTEAEVSLGKNLDHGEVQQLLGNILEECERLTRVTDQLLTLARQDAGSGQRRQEPVNMVELVRDVLETLRPLAEAKGLALVLKPSSPPSAAAVSGDRDQLRQVLINVLDNAIKYTAEGSVTVAVESAGENVAVSVSDTGAGIPWEHLPHLFERFYRVDKARSRELGGSGLGLSIAKDIVEAHGGRIGLNSVVRQGTTCTVTLPVEPAQG
jgi:heavy metal sensor kinase